MSAAGVYIGVYVYGGVRGGICGMRLWRYTWKYARYTPVEVLGVYADEGIPGIRR